MEPKLLFEYLEALYMSGNFDMEEVMDNEAGMAYHVSSYLLMNTHGNYYIYGPKGETLTNDEVLTLALELSLKKES